MIHGLALTAWLSLLAAQALLVKTARAHVHRGSCGLGLQWCLRP